MHVVAETVCDYIYVHYPFNYRIQPKYRTVRLGLLKLLGKKKLVVKYVSTY